MTDVDAQIDECDEDIYRMYLRVCANMCMVCGA